jgi:hypothetical protein
MVTEPTLRFAVCTDVPITSWQARCVDLLAAVPGVRLDQWIQLPPGRASGTPNLVEGDPCGPVPESLRAVEIHSPRHPEGLGAPRIGEVDVVLDLSTGETPQVAQRGAETWRFGHGARASRDYARVALADYVRGPGVTRTALISDPSGLIVRVGWPRSASWFGSATLEASLLELAEWPAIAARERLAGRGAPVVPASGDPLAGADRPAPRRRRRLDTLPRPVLMLGAAARRTEEIAVSLTRHPEWNVGIMPAPIDAILRAGDRRPIEWLPARRDAWAADPFGIERDGELHIFFEDFSRKVNRGVISHVSVGRDGAFSDPECVLDVGVHASYPFLVERDGRVFMLPETSAAGELVLYEAVEFPRCWRRVKTLLPGVAAVDASVVEHEGRWWMFAGIKGRGQNHTLFVWHAPDLTGPWTSHAANPVKTDARSTRSGGTPFVVDGVLFRPSQDCAQKYGGRVVLNEVELLSPTAFSERPVKALGPRRGSLYSEGLHTLAAAGTRTLIDGYGRRFVREDMQRQVTAKLRRVLASARG